MPTKVAQVRQLLYNNEEIGMGFNSDTGLAVGTALEFDTPTRDPGQTVPSATADIVTTHDQLMDTLNISAQVQGHYAFASGSAKVDFSKKTGYNSVSTFVVAHMVITNIITRGHNFRISQNAKALLDSNQIDAFQTAFGDSFVRGLFTGGEFYAVMRITSVDTSVQTDLAVKLQMEINGGVAGGSFSGALNKANSEQHSRAEFHVTYYQSGGAGEAEIGTTLSVDEVKARLHNLPTAVMNHPVPHMIEVATYDTIPIPLPSKEQQEDFLMALADADQKKLQYLQQYNDLMFAHDNPDFFEDPPDAMTLQTAAGVYLQAVNAVIDHAVRLSNGQINPPQFFDPAKVNPPLVLPSITLRKKNMGLERSFADWYIFRNDPTTLREDQKLVNEIVLNAQSRLSNFEAIVDPSGDPAKTDKLRGDALATAVNTLTEISFTGGNSEAAQSGLTSIAHLPTMLPPTMQRVDLSFNQLLNLRGIEHFTSLVSLDMTYNRIGDISPLSALTLLKELKIAGNEIVDLTPLQGLSNLKTLYLEGLVVEYLNGRSNSFNATNPIQDATALKAIPGLANPFVLGDKLSVRWGNLKQGAGAQFTGTAERIGRSHRFAVHLTRGNESLAD